MLDDMDEFEMSEDAEVEEEAKILENKANEAATGEEDVIYGVEFCKAGDYRNTGDATPSGGLGFCSLEMAEKFIKGVAELYLRCEVGAGYGMCGSELTARITKTDTSGGGETEVIGFYDACWNGLRMTEETKSFRNHVGELVTYTDWEINRDEIDSRMIALAQMKDAGMKHRIVKFAHLGEEED